MSTNYLIRPPRISEASSHLQTSLVVQPPLPWTKVIEKKTRWQSPWFVWNSLIGLLVHLLIWSPTLWQVNRHFPVTFLVLVPGQVTSGEVPGCPPCSGRGEVCNTVSESCECDTGYYVTASSPANDTSAVTGCEEGGWNISSLLTTLIIVTASSEFRSLSPPISPVPARCLSFLLCIAYTALFGFLPYHMFGTVIKYPIENGSLTISHMILFCVL